MTTLVTVEACNIGVGWSRGIIPIGTVISWLLPLLILVWAIPIRPIVLVTWSVIGLHLVELFLDTLQCFGQFANFIRCVVHHWSMDHLKLWLLVLLVTSFISSSNGNSFIERWWTCSLYMESKVTLQSSYKLRDLCLDWKIIIWVYSSD